MSADRFWTGFARRDIAETEKQAGFGVALLAHAGANALMQGALKTQYYGRRLGRQFIRGLTGQQMSNAEQFAGGLVSGAGVPEFHVAKEHMMGLGHQVNKAMQSQGLNQLTARDQTLLRVITEGRFPDLVTNPGLQKTPAFAALAQVAEQQTGTDIRQLLLAAKAGGPARERALDALQKLQSAWQNKKESPITANVFANITHGKPTGRNYPKPVPISQVPENASTGNRAHLAGSAIGGTALAVADPITAAANAAKVVTLNPESRNIISKVPAGKWALEKADKFFIADPLREAARQGAQGIQTKPNVGRTYLLNAFTESMRHSANRLAAAGQQAVPDVARPHVSQALHDLRPRNWLERTMAPGGVSGPA